MFIRLILSIFIIFSFVFPAQQGKGLCDIDEHLTKYANVNDHRHDNIDDSVEVHEHKHKHSEDGEEHEHHHNHTKIAQYEVKLLINKYSIKTHKYEIESSQNFNYKFLVSSAHPSELFRPPIS